MALSLNTNETEWTEKCFQTLTPRSEETMKRLGLVPEELVPMDVPLMENDQFKYDVAMIRYKQLQKLQAETISRARKLRKKLIREKWEPEKTSEALPEAPRPELMSLALQHSGLFEENPAQAFLEKQETSFNRLVTRQVESCLEELVKTARVAETARTHKKSKNRLKSPGKMTSRGDGADARARKQQRLEALKEEKKKEMFKKLEKSVKRLEEIEQQKNKILEENARQCREKREATERRQKVSISFSQDTLFLSLTNS